MPSVYKTGKGCQWVMPSRFTPLSAQGATHPGIPPYTVDRVLPDHPFQNALSYYEHSLAQENEHWRGSQPRCQLEKGPPSRVACGKLPPSWGGFHGEHRNKRAKE